MIVFQPQSVTNISTSLSANVLASISDSIALSASSSFNPVYLFPLSYNDGDVSVLTTGSILETDSIPTSGLRVGSGGVSSVSYSLSAYGRIQEGTGSISVTFTAASAASAPIETFTRTYNLTSVQTPYTIGEGDGAVTYPSYGEWRRKRVLGFI